MTRTQPLLIPDLDRLRRKLIDPSPPLAGLLARFRKQLGENKDFRTANIHLDALLGDETAARESKEIVLRESKAFRTRGPEDGAVEHHTWCVAPSAMRMAVFYSWLDHQGCWSADESRAVAEGLLHFSYEHAAAVLRGRAPTADNQSLSLALCCAITGYAFRALPGVSGRAQSLHEFGMRRLALVLGLGPRDGYFLEGSTYQSCVVSPLAMWAGAFLAQIEGETAATRKWLPVGVSLLDILRVESLLGSPGLLLPSWDNYGWQHKINLSPIAYWASLTGHTEALLDAAAVWDRANNIAWGHDDRMWALIYWPEQGGETREPAALSGWSLPETAAAIDDHARRARLMLAWDKSTSWLQALSRGQVNPNHVTYEIDGEPIFADGMPADHEGFLGIKPEHIAAPLDAGTRELVIKQYGTLDRWANAQHSGLIGGANTVFVDDDAGYFPLTAKRGQLCYEKRSADRYVVAAECVDYFLPKYDLTRARRTIAMNRDGVCWIVDDYRAASSHRFTWQLYLRPGCTLIGEMLRIKPSSGQELTLAWLPAGPTKLDRVEGYPSNAPAFKWPDQGSERLRFGTTGERAVFVVCLVPWRAESMAVRPVGANTWRVEWNGGGDTLVDDAADAVANKQIEDPEALCDLDDAPFALSEEPDGVLLQALKQPDPADWRRTTIAMQTLTQRRVAEAMPLIDSLLRDSAQRYHIHSVAAWCLGRSQHRPSLEYLHCLTKSPETNTALHARWAVERMG